MLSETEKNDAVISSSDTASCSCGRGTASRTGEPEISGQDPSRESRLPQDPEPGHLFHLQQDPDSVAESRLPQEPEPGRFLKNPLPVPKRRQHVKMEFDLIDDWDIPPEQDHFDYDVAEDDDFDI